MSHLSFVDWNIRIGAGTVALERRHARLTRRGWIRTRSVETSAWLPTTGEPRWDSLRAALASLIAPEEAMHARAQVVLSNSLVRYAVLPWHSALAGPEQDRIFLAHRFRQLYGDSAVTWQLRCEYASAGRARLASAVDPGLVDAIEDALRARGIKLKSVVPALADTVNRNRTRIGSSSAWLVCYEEGWLCLARWHQWEWIAARSLRAGAGWRCGLPAMLAREECLHDAPEEATTLYVDAGGDPPESMPGWTVLPLRAAEEKQP